MHRITATVLGAALLTATLVACGDDDGTVSGGSTATTAPAATVAAGANQPNDADITFVQGMIPHHRQAVDMADLVLERGSNATVKDLARRIRNAQEPEIQIMTGWLTTWGKSIQPPMSHDGMDTEHGMMSNQEMASMEALTGSDLDKMFVEMMIRHHQGAIAMARTEVDSGQFPDATALARSIATSQQAEVEEMTTLRQQLG